MSCYIMSNINKLVAHKLIIIIQNKKSRNSIIIINCRFENIRLLLTGHFQYRTLFLVSFVNRQAIK